MDPSQPPSDSSAAAAVTDAIAAREGVAPEELQPPLYEVLDPEALEDLFRDGHGRVTFEYRDYEVTVDHETAVEVEPK